MRNGDITARDPGLLKNVRNKFTRLRPQLTASHLDLSAMNFDQNSRMRRRHEIEQHR